MSETDDEERRKRKELKRRRREKKKRKAERMLKGEDTQEELHTSNTTVQVRETEDEARLRRKKEKKEARRLKKHKEASAAGQKAASDAGTPAKKADVVKIAPSAANDPKEGRGRKRKSRPAEEAGEFRQNSAETAVETLPPPFQPSQSGSGRNRQESTRKKPRADATPSKSNLPRISVQAQIDRAVSKPESWNKRQKENGAGSSGGERSAIRASPSQSASQATTTKEGTLEDALHLSHTEMLVDRLYHSKQLKWLQEERDLKVKSGKFSQWEKQRIQEYINAFKAEQQLSDEDFIVWLFGDRKGKEDKDLYTAFWRSVTASLVDRPNRAVRIAVRRSLQPDTLRGAWSDAENERLRSAVETSGRNWSAVAAKVGLRTAEDCRLRWRNHAPDVEAKRVKGRFKEDDKENLTVAVQTVCEEAGLDPMSLDSKIPWKRVAEEMGGERSPAQCLIKWQAMLKEANGRYDLNKWKWKLIDSKIFTDRLANQKEALEKDDFTEVRLSSLRSPSWLMDPTRMLHNWKSLVRKYVSPTAYYKTNFRSNLKSIKYGLDAMTDEVMVRRRHRRGDTDEIDSDEEV